MRSNLIVDDHLLTLAIARVAPDEVLTAMNNGELFTTGSWYYRLGRAMKVPTFTGRCLVDSKHCHLLTKTSSSEQSMNSEDVGLISLRHVIPVMSELDASEHRLNVLTAEAVAAALLTHARVLVLIDTPLLAKACETLGIEYAVLAL